MQMHEFLMNHSLGGSKTPSLQLEATKIAAKAKVIIGFRTGWKQEGFQLATVLGLNICEVHRQRGALNKGP
jgi:hypothetical protein